jgi:hypothetical protein
MEFCIPHKRNLSGEEKGLLAFLVKGQPGHEARIDRLKVVARCGCGKCPTVLFGESFDDEPITTGYAEIADYWGRAANGTLVGVMLFESGGQIVQLEAIGWDGDVDVWPPVDSLVPTNVAVASLDSPEDDSKPLQAPVQTHQRKRMTTTQKVWALISLLMLTGFLLRLLSNFIGRPI